MNIDVLNKKLETLKNILVCLALVCVIFTSCRKDKTSAIIADQIANLSAVVYEDMAKDPEAAPADDTPRPAVENTAENSPGF